MVKALYKLEGRGFETYEANEFFWKYVILPAALGPGAHLASNKNEYQKQLWENSICFYSE
jgi:hypothetical protein